MFSVLRLWNLIIDLSFRFHKHLHIFIPVLLWDIFINHSRQWYYRHCPSMLWGSVAVIKDSPAKRKYLCFNKCLSCHPNGHSCYNNKCHPSSIPISLNLQRVTSEQRIKWAKSYEVTYNQIIFLEWVLLAVNWREYTVGWEIRKDQNLSLIEFFPLCKYYCV